MDNVLAKVLADENDFYDKQFAEIVQMSDEDLQRDLTSMRLVCLLGTESSDFVLMGFMEAIAAQRRSQNGN